MNIEWFTLRYSNGLYNLYYREKNRYSTDGYTFGKEVSINGNNLILDGRIFIIVSNDQTDGKMKNY